MRKLVERIVIFFAKKSHDVKIQVVLAALYGIIHIYGIGAVIPILIKLRKSQHAQTRVRPTRKVDSPTTVVPKGDSTVTPS